MNIFLSSISKKVPLIQAIRRTLKRLNIRANILGGDADSSVIGQHFLDGFWHMPPLAGLQGEEFLDYCLKKKVQCVIPTRDGELHFYARQREFLSAQGVHCMVSKPAAIEVCLDKYLFYQTLQALGFPAIETSLQPENWQGRPLVVKERHGAGSRSIGLNLTREAALTHAAGLRSPLFQPYYSGQEISVDLYVNRKGNTQGVIARYRTLVVQGESQITQTFSDPALEEACARLAEKLDLYGHVMFQLIRCKDGIDRMLECNPRFGGASTLSLEMGLNSIGWVWSEALGQECTVFPYRREFGEKTLIRYAEDLFV